MKIIYVIDTNLFIHQPNFRNALSLSTIVIPKRTSQELNGLKKSQDIETSVMARHGIKWMDALGCQGDLAKGVSLPNGAVVQTVAKAVSGSYSNEAGDDEILRTAIFLKEEHPDQKVILLTNDHGFLVLARQHVYAQHYSDNQPHFSYYDRLGVYERATAEEITQAYRSLCKEYHPDHHQQSPLYNALMAEINEAYDVLSVPAKKQRYDSYELPMWHRQFHSTSQGQARTGTGYTYQSAGQRRTYGNVRTAEDIWKEATKTQTPPVRRGLSPFLKVVFLIVFLSFFPPFSTIIDNIFNGGNAPASYAHVPAKTTMGKKHWYHRNRLKRQVTETDLRRVRIEAEIRRIHNSYGYVSDNTTPFIGPNLGTPFADRLKVATDYLQLGEPENSFKELGPAADMLYSSMAAMKALGRDVAGYMPDKQNFMAVFIPACQEYLASHSRQDLEAYFNSHWHTRQLSGLLATLSSQSEPAIVNTSAEDWSANRGTKIPLPQQIN